MGFFSVLLVLHVVVVGAIVAGRALHARLGPVVATAEPSAALALTPSIPPPLPTGRALEEYIEAGLVDLRIMLVQAARRGRD